MGNILVEIGPYLTLIVVGGFILVMILRGPWRWSQILAGVLLAAALYGNFPHFPAALNGGLTAVVHSFQK